MKLNFASCVVPDKFVDVFLFHISFYKKLKTVRMNLAFFQFKKKKFNGIIQELLVELFFSQALCCCLYLANFCQSTHPSTNKWLPTKQNYTTVSTAVDIDDHKFILK